MLLRARSFSTVALQSSSASVVGGVCCDCVAGLRCTALCVVAGLAVLDDAVLVGSCSRPGGDLDLLVLSVLYGVCRLSGVKVSVVVAVACSCWLIAGAGDGGLLCGGDSGTGMAVAGSGVIGIVR